MFALNGLSNTCDVCRVIVNFRTRRTAKSLAIILYRVISCSNLECHSSL